MSNKYEKIWRNANWTLQARQLLRGLSRLSNNSKIVLILRHSHRISSKDAEKLAKLRLTPQGHEIAKILGSLLPKERPIRLFHSIVKRCEETAENILRGFKEKGGKGELKGVLDALYDIGTDGIYIIKKAVEHAGQKFLNHWAAGLYPPNKIKTLSSYSKESAFEIWKLLDNAPENGIDIHISHDLSIMGFRLGWFGLPAQDWWVSFMGGFAFTFDDSQIHLLDKGRIKKVEIPYWWH